MTVVLGDKCMLCDNELLSVDASDSAVNTDIARLTENSRPFCIIIIVNIIRPHRSTTQMQPTATDEVAWSVGRSVSHDSKPCNTAEPMPFGLWTRVGPMNHVLDGVQMPCVKGQ